MMKSPFKGAEPCTEVDPVMFDLDKSTTRWDVAVLRKVCAPCEVREACGEYAMSEDLLGFWGGMTTSERTQVKRQRRRENNVNQRNA